MECSHSLCKCQNKKLGACIAYANGKIKNGARIAYANAKIKKMVLA